jgi:hypothetical protein
MSKTMCCSVCKKDNISWRVWADELMAVAKINLFIVIIAKMKLQLFLRRPKMNNLEQEEKKMNPLAHAVYDQVIEEFISGDTNFMSDRRIK